MDTRYDASPSVESVTTYSEMRSINGVSWGAILAGVFVALTVATVLNLLGLGLDLLALGAHKAHMGLATMVWIVLTSIISMLAGGWVAGRMCGPALATEGALHGIVMCGVATFITFVIAAASLGSLIGLMSTVIAQGNVAFEIAHQNTYPMPMFPPKPGMQNIMLEHQHQQQFHQDLHDYLTAHNQADEAKARAHLSDYLVQNQMMTPEQAQQAIDNLQNKKQQITAQADEAAKHLGTLVLIFFVSFLLSAIASAFGGIRGAASDRDIFIRKQVKVKR